MIYYSLDIEQDIQQSKNILMDPCSNIYEYVCGNWGRNNPIPTGKLKWSENIKLQYNINSRIHKLLAEENKYDNLSFIKIAKDYYRSCMNEDAIEDEGLKPVNLILNATGGWPILMSDEEWNISNYTWQNINNFYNGMFDFINFFGIGYKQDSTEDRNIILIHQYLTYPGNEMTEFFENQNFDTYKEFIIKIVHTFAKNEGIQISTRKLEESIDEMITFETRLRNISGSAKELHFLKKTLKMTIAELQQSYNMINWLDVIQSFFKNVNVSIKSSEPVFVSIDHSLQKLATLLDDTKPHVIVNYIQWNVVSRLIQLLNKQIKNIEFEYYYSDYNETMSEPRWLKCVQDFPMKDIISYLFIDAYTLVDTKAILIMVNEIKTELKEQVLFSWMSDDMKKSIVKRIDSILPLIGYPDDYHNQTIFIERYKELNIDKNYFSNWLRVKKDEINKTRINFRKEVSVIKNRDKWIFDPLLTNAYYISESNAIVIPAALINDLYFDSATPIAISYATIGSIIGHELSYSFGPDEFVMIILDGDLHKIHVNNEDILVYVRKTQCFIDQYHNLVLNVTRRRKPVQRSVKRAITALRRNIAEFIGVEAAFAAFMKKARKKSQTKLPALLNISGEKLFFLSFVNQFCESTREYKTNLVQIKKYGFANFRVINSLTNMVSFSKAFDCRVGSLMNPESKCTIFN